jgi:hypothetical protein
MLERADRPLAIRPSADPTQDNRRDYLLLLIRQDRTCSPPAAAQIDGKLFNRLRVDLDRLAAEAEGTDPLDLYRLNLASGPLLRRRFVRCPVCRMMTRIL